MFDDAIGPPTDEEEAAAWDELYRGDGEERMWSGRPNGTLVAEVAGLTPGTALDVGCGEGADAIWLASRGWRVTAVDPSAVAIARARAAGEAAGVDVRWVTSGLLAMPGGPGAHDLVSLQYPALRADRGDPISVLLGAVAPGGTLLFVHHDQVHDEAHGGPGHAHGHDSGHLDDDGHEHDAATDFDPADYVMPDDVRARLLGGDVAEEWEVLVDEVRQRPGPLPPDATHVRDVVLRVRRR